MLLTLSIWQWFKLAASFFLFFMPGFLLIGAFWGKRTISFGQKTSLAFGLSLGVWCVLLVWLDFLNLSLNTGLVRMFFGLCLAFVILQIAATRTLPYFPRAGIQGLEMFITVLSALLILFFAYLLRDLASGMGSDSMHHTLIPMLMLKYGQIPSNYDLFAPVSTFTYHFGYHAFVSAISWLSGVSPQIVVILSGAFFVGLCAFIAAVMIETVTKNKLMALCAVPLIGLIYIFPSYSLMWGRYTQFLATMLLMVLITAILVSEETSGFSRKDIPLFVLLTAGLFFSHYRIFLAACLFLGCYFLVRLVKIKEKKEYFWTWVFIGLGTAVVSLPWIIRLLDVRFGSLGNRVLISDPTYFSLARLGPLFAGEFQNIFLIILAGVSGLFGIARKNTVALSAMIWVALIWVLSLPGKIGSLLDPVTMMISSYLPVVLLLLIGVDHAYRMIKNRRIGLLVNLLLVCVVVYAAGIGIVRWVNIDFEPEEFVTFEDVQAGKWIEQNTPSDALFVTNTYQFSFQEELVTAMDAGYWLPVIAHRPTLIPPMVYLIERMNAEDVQYRGAIVHSFGGHLGSQEAVEYLLSQGVDYLYLGAKGGIINSSEIDASMDYALVYNTQSVRVYKILEH